MGSSPHCLPLPALLAALFTVFCSGVEAAVENLAPSGTATSKSSGFGGLASFANDGNRDGDFANNSVFHSAGGTGPGEWWEVDLGGTYYIDRVFIFPRTDSQQDSVRDFTLEIFDDAGSVSWSADFLPDVSTGDDPWGSSAMSGIQGRRVRLTLKDPNSSAVNFLTFAELEVWGSAGPLPPNIASEATLASATPGFGATIDNGVDGDLAANFFAASDADGPIFHDEILADQGFYRLDFGSDVTIAEIQLYNRIVNNTATTTSEYRVSILDASGATVATQTVTAEDRDYDHLLDFGNATGRSVLVEETFINQFLAFSEIRIIAPQPAEEAIEIVSITRNPGTRELTITASLKADTLYFFERSRNLADWIDESDDIKTSTGTVEVKFTPEENAPEESYRFREIPPVVN